MMPLFSLSLLCSCGQCFVNVLVCAQPSAHAQQLAVLAIWVGSYGVLMPAAAVAVLVCWLLKKRVAAWFVHQQTRATIWASVNMKSFRNR